MHIKWRREEEEKKNLFFFPGKLMKINVIYFEQYYQYVAMSWKDATHSIMCMRNRKILTTIMKATILWEAIDLIKKKNEEKKLNDLIR